MKTKTLFTLLLTLMCLLGAKLYAVEHGSISEKNVQLYLDGESKDGYMVDFKLVSVGSMTYAYINGSGYTLAATNWGSQVRYEGEKQCPVVSRTGNLSIWDFATPSPQSSSIHIMQEEDNNFYITQNFVYDKTARNSPIAGDVTKPNLSTAVASEIADNSITITMSATDENDFFYYVSTPDMETVSFLNTTTISGLMSGTAYSFSIIAIDFSGNESEPIIVNATTTGARPVFNPADNLALNKSSTAASGVASDGNNGNYGDRWRGGADNNPIWWEVNLGAEYVINQVKIFLDPNDNAGGSAYEIQTRLSSADEWATVATITDAVTKENRIINFDATPTRYVRYYGTAIANWDHNFAEFEVYGTGYYDPDAGNELANVFVTPVNATTYVGDDFQFTALATTGAGTTIEDAVFSWSLLEDTGADISSTGLFTATVTGTYTVNVATTVDGITKSGTTTVNVGEARVATTITFNQKIENVAASNASNVFFINEFVPFTLEVRDQYGSIMTDIEINYQATNGGIVDENAKTVAWSTHGNNSLSVTAGEVTESINITIVQGFEIPKGALSATASSGDANLAIDGDNETRWISGSTVEGVAQDESLIIDMSAFYKLSAIDIRWEGACAATYTIEVSVDGGSYRSLGGESRGNGVFAHTYRVVETEDDVVRFIRINCTVPATQYGYSIYEVTAYGKDVDMPSDITIVNKDNENEYICWPAATDATSGMKEYEVYKNDVLIESIPHVEGETEYCFSIYTESGMLKSTQNVTYKIVAIDNAGNQTASNSIVVAVTITGISEEEVQAISINQFDNKIFIESANKITSIQLYSINGQLIAVAKDNNVLDTLGLTNGLYIIHIVDQYGNTSVEKLIIR